MINPSTRYKEIGSRIKESRERSKLTQAKLAELLDFESPTAISLLEGGHRSIAVHTLEKIAEVLHVSVTHLLGIEEKTPTLKAVLRSTTSLSGSAADNIADFVEFMEKRDGNGKN